MRKLRIALSAIALSMAMSTVAYAGAWKQDTTGWAYQNDDDSYIKSQWFQDFDGKWFYLNDQGYMLTNGTAPDGRQVGGDGAWVQAVSGDTKKVLREINSWLISDIWGNGYCDFGWYEYNGKDSTGSEIDIEYAYQLLCDNYKKKAGYEAFINALPEEYSSLKTAWGKLSPESDRIYAYYKQHGVHQTNSETVNTDLFEQYQEAFSKYVREVK